ncbi:uncharacterized protein LOC141899146 [Tubulanus polymorphus]|uniref:uncharacterized protein LOC141899146 n=1 Tax=Tubulanus polymorphus TaxID=672921 RepID=UPI003DA1F873
MDDPRIEWLRNRVFDGLNILDAVVYEELLNRDDGVFEREIAKFLNETPEEHNSALLFYKTEVEEEEEVEIECEPEIPDIQEEEFTDTLDEETPAQTPAIEELTTASSAPATPDTDGKKSKCKLSRINSLK